MSNNDFNSSSALYNLPVTESRESDDIDLNEIRNKYLKIKEFENKKQEIRQVKAHSGDKLKGEDLARLNNYRICMSCSGKGTVKSIYNHMVLERDCEECDGESVVLTNQRLAELAEGLL